MGWRRVELALVRVGWRGLSLVTPVWSGDSHGAGLSSHPVWLPHVCAVCADHTPDESTTVLWQTTIRTDSSPHLRSVQQLVKLKLVGFGHVGDVDTVLIASKFTNENWVLPGIWQCRRRQTAVSVLQDGFARDIGEKVPPVKIHDDLLRRLENITPTLNAQPGITDHGPNVRQFLSDLGLTGNIVSSQELVRGVGGQCRLVGKLNHGDSRRNVGWKTLDVLNNCIHSGVTAGEVGGVVEFGLQSSNGKITTRVLVAVLSSWKCVNVNQDLHLVRGSPVDDAGEVKVLLDWIGPVWLITFGRNEHPEGDSYANEVDATSVSILKVNLANVIVEMSGHDL